MAALIRELRKAVVAWRSWAMTAGLAIVFLTRPIPAPAAQVTYEPGHGNQSGVIYINGSIEAGDAASFDTIVNNIPDGQAVVISSGLGGSIAEALAIGERIHAKHFATGVHYTCASACALIWLAGANRFIDETTSIGFHAAYTGSTLHPHESGKVNAVIGAYLAKLGFSYGFVAFVTTAPPTSMVWLKVADAQRFGVIYALSSGAPPSK